MALTKIFVVLLLVGIMSGTLAAPDQTAELEKSNEYGDTQDAKDNIAQDFAAPDEIEAVERPDRPVELEEDDENGNVQYSRVYCVRVYGICLRLGYNNRICIRVYRKCRARSVSQDDEDRPVELEEDDENGNVQYSHAHCVRVFRSCMRRGYNIRICIWGYRKCRARSVSQDDEDRPVELEEDDENGNTQDIKDNIPQDFAAPDQIEAVERPDRPIELEEDDENGNVQRPRAYCVRVYRTCLSHGHSRRQCRKVYRSCRRRSVSQDEEGYSHE